MVKTNIPAPGIISHATAGTNDIRSIKAPVPIPNLWFWAACLFAALVLAALAFWWWRKRRRETPSAPEVVIPPHEKARERLREALALMDQPQPFCILVSDTVRVYLEERFTLHAPERTTEEFLEELQTSPFLTYEQKQVLGEFLSGCDLVKFARYEPGRSELQAIYDAALRLVEETQPAAPWPAGPAETARSNSP